MKAISRSSADTLRPLFAEEMSDPTPLLCVNAPPNSSLRHFFVCHRLKNVRPGDEHVARLSTMR